MKYIWNFRDEEHESKVGREPRPVGIGAHLEKNRRTRGLARGNPRQNAQTHQASRLGRRRGVEVDGHSDLVARWHHLHWRILQECREAYLRQGRVSEGSGPSLQRESRRKRTPRDRHPRRRRNRRVRLQGARSPSDRPKQLWQVETFGAWKRSVESGSLGSNTIVAQFEVIRRCLSVDFRLGHPIT